MRVMVFVKATPDSEKGLPPSAEMTKMFEAMGKFNEELVKAGVMLAGDGLKPSSHGKRVAFDGPNRTAELCASLFSGATGFLDATRDLAGGLFEIMSQHPEIPAADLICCLAEIDGVPVNNLRDLEQDKLAGKRTLAVLVGSRAARILFGVFALLPFAILAFFCVFYFKAPLVYFALLAILPAVLITSTAKTASEFMVALRLTSLTALVFGLGLGAALAF